jgi:hypothetical protein
MLTKKFCILIGALTILSAGVMDVGAYILSKKPTLVLEVPGGEISEESISLKIRGERE